MATENPNSNEVRPHSAAGMPQAGARTDANGNAVHNKILSALPDREFDELRARGAADGHEQSHVAEVALVLTPDADVVGGIGWAYNQPTNQSFSAYGYPAGYPFDGQSRKSCGPS